MSPRDILRASGDGREVLKAAKRGRGRYSLRLTNRARKKRVIARRFVPHCGAKPISGRPDPKHISTSFVERQNLTMRMGMRRFTRLINAFSKKVDNHASQVALHFMHYNFCRIHKSLRVTPAMEAGVTDHVWTIEEMLDRVGLK